MGQELQLPDWAKAPNAAMPAAFQVLNAADDTLSEGIGQSYAVISYKGKVWSIRYRGEKHNFLRPDDGTPSAYLDMIILGQAKQKSKSFYEKYDQAQGDGGSRPLCSSIDGLIPDPDVQSKQCDTCALCPRNVWKQDPTTGKKGRECTDYKRLAVLILPTMTKAALGQPLLEPAFLRVPPASLNSLAILGDTMASRGFHYSSYITRVTFDPNKPHPEMQFRPLQGLTNEEGPVIIGMRADNNVDRIINGGFSDAGMRVVPPQENSILIPPGTTSTGIAAHPQQQAQRQPQMIEATAQPSTVGLVSLAGQAGTQANVSTNLASAQPVITNGGNPAPVTPMVTSPAPTGSGASNPTGLVDTGFGGATLAPTQQAQPLSQTPPASMTVGDAGAPEASDMDLDARIAGLITKA